MPLDDWNHLRFFLGVLDAGSLSAAARTMGVEHTTVARRIDALERSLGLRLFDRLAGGWQPTAHALALVPAARRVEAQVHGLLRAAQAEAPQAGPVTVSAPPAIVTCLLARALPAALASHAGLELRLIGESQHADVARGETDIAIRYRRPDAPDLAVRALAEVRYALYATPAYLSTHAPDDWTFLGFDTRLADAPHARWLERHAAQRPFAMRSNDLLALAQAAGDGIGVALLPPYAAAHVSGLVRLAVACDVRRTLWLVLHDDVRRAPGVRAVADAVVHLFATQAVV